MLSVLLLGCVVFAALSIVIHSLRVGISPMPTSSRVKPLILELVPPDTTELHELGAGWGTLALPLARALPNTRVIAWESSPIPFAVLWLRARLSGQRNLTLHRADFFTADLRTATTVICYLWTGAMQRLDTKLRAELAPGAIIITNTFALHGWRAEQTRIAADLYRTHVYRYRV